MNIEFDVRTLFTDSQVERIEVFSRENHLPFEIGALKLLSQMMDAVATPTATPVATPTATPVATPKPKPKRVKAVLRTVGPFDSLGTRARNALEKIGVTSLEELAPITEEELQALPSCGAKTIDEIMEFKASKFGGGAPEEEVEEPAEVEVAPTGVIDRFNSLSLSRAGVREASKLFMAAMATHGGGSLLSYKDDAAALLRDVGYDKDDQETYLLAIEALRDGMPVQAEQIKRLRELEKELDIDFYSSENVYIEALTCGEANKLIVKTEQSRLHTMEVEELAYMFFEE